MCVFMILRRVALWFNVRLKKKKILRRVALWFNVVRFYDFTLCSFMI